MKLLLLALALAQAASGAHSAIGEVRRDAPALDALIAPDARIEKLADGITWSEGPAWVGGGDGYLLFDDVPANHMYRWSEADGLSVFMDPSGFAGPDFSSFREAGANGLFAEPGGTVLVADSGTRAIARLDPATKKKTLLATHFQGHRFNSPNDLVRAANGAIYFTDPPYGLKDLDQSKVKELPSNGVYRLDPDGTVTLLDDTLSRPNGIALSPDGRTLYASNSDPDHPVWIAYRLDGKGGVSSRRVFADAAAEVKRGLTGLPDGMCIDAAGNLFASGPGGLHVFTPEGRLIGLIETGDIVSNCAFGGSDGRMLYMTSNHMVVRLATRTRGLVLR